MRRPLTLLLLCAAACDGAPPESGPPLEATAAAAEAPCAQYVPTRRALFGDFHVHTQYSFDANSFGTTVDPRTAYRFAKGEPVTLTSGVPVQLTHALDFTAITDHSELLTASEWTGLQQAAAEHYDTTSACRFTTFAAYEWSKGTPGADTMTNLHRNVIFRNANVIATPINSLRVPQVEDLWRQLDAQCNDAGTGCQALTIPHNSNYSGGLMFALDPALTAQQAADRQRLEPLVEIFQGKGGSECKRGAGGATDAACDFEQVQPPVCDGTNANDCLPLCTQGQDPTTCIAPLSFVRNALKSGLAAEATLGVNPLKLGFIAATDTHNGTPGATDESSWEGHHGRNDDTARERVRDFGKNNPGGLIAVWAEQNRRDNIYDALVRRETYGTSGTRLNVRFFGGFGFPSNLCGDLTNLVNTGYASGVPMGGDLRGPGSGAPRFAVSAAMDPDGALLERVQIVKGWRNADGTTSERVVDVAVAPTAQGSTQLCAVWTDPTFSADRRAFYYARVLEVPSPRWSTTDCQSLTAAPASCRDGSMPTNVRERAWTSPIWYTP